MDIVMLWYQNDWEILGRRYERIARTWAARYPEDRILVVEPPMNPWVWFRQVRHALFSGDRVMALYWLSRLICLWKPLRRESPNLTVMRIFFPWPFRSSAEGFLTRFSFLKALRRLEKFLRRNGWSEPLLWAYPPHLFVRYAAERWRGPVCADLVDDNTRYRSISESLRKEYEASYRRVVEKASVIFTVSQNLQEKFSDMNKPVIHVPNAFSVENFSSEEVDAIQKTFRPLPSGPRVCYAGNIDERLDWNLLKSVISDRPQVQFIFIGGFGLHFRKAWDERLGGLPNVHYWGTVPFRRLLPVVKSMDVCILPHLTNRLTDSMDPLKLYLYLAAQKSVVSTSCAIDAQLEPWVERAATPEEFSRALDRALDPASLRRHISERAQISIPTWTERVELMARHLQAPCTIS